MPARHSKNSSDKHHFTYHEKMRSGLGTLKQRLGSASQLPFGYCALSMYPAEDAVVSPSGHLYSRESILQYILTKTREIKEQTKLFEEQQLKKQQDELRTLKKIQAQDQQQFAEVADGMVGSSKRKLDEEVAESDYFKSRKKVIDDTDKEVKLEELKKVSPWIPQFTPEAKEAEIKEPPKRPASPFSGRPLRAKDLIPVNLIKESPDSTDNSQVRYICPVSRKTITHQKVVMIKTTGALMLEQTAKDLAYPTKVCPLTGKKFEMSDVIELTQAASAFSSTGQVEAQIHRPTLN